jgi:hypothetical protein
MKEIHLAYGQIAPCSDTNPNGHALEIFYTVEGDTVTVTTEQGKPLSDSWGKPISKKLTDGDDARKIAVNLGLRHWRSARDPMDDFNRPISPREYAPIPY